MGTDGTCQLQAQSVSTAVGGNWNAIGTWASGGIPVAGSTVIINGPVTLVAASSCANLTVNAGGTLNTVTYTFGVSGPTLNAGIINGTTGTKTFTGATTISSGGTMTLTSTGTMAFSAPLTIDAGGTLSSTGAATFNLNGGGSNAGTMTMNAGGSVNVGATQTFTNNASATMSATLAGTGTWVNANGSSLTYSNATAPMNTGVLNASAASNTVTYSGAAQNIKGAVYNTLILGGSSVIKTATGNVTVDNAFTIPATITFATAAVTFTASNTTSISGILSGATGIKTFTGITTVENGGTLTLSAAGTANFTSALNINSGGTLSSTSTGTFNLNAGGTNNGTMTLNSGGILAIAIGQTFTNNATASMTASLNAGDATSTWINANGSTLTYGNITNAPMNLGILDASTASNTVTYSFGSQSVKGTTYNTLAFSGTGTKTSVGNIDVTNLINIPSGVTFNLSTFNFTSNAGIVNSGTFTDNNALGTNLIVGLFTNNGSFTNTGNAAFEFQNGIVNNGTTFSTGSGTLLFSTNDQNISGTSNTTFSGNVNIGDNVTFTNNIPSLTINGILTGLSATATFTAAVNTTLTYPNNNIPMSGGVLNVSANPNTFIYSSTTGTQNVKETTYHNLTFSGNAARNVPNITVNGNFLRSAGGIVASSSTWTFETANAATFSPVGSVSFPNIVVNKAGGSLTLTPSAISQTTTMLSLTVGAGSLVFGSAFTTTLTLTDNLSGAGTLDMSGLAGHTLNLGGATNVIQNYLAPAATGSSTVNYNRAGDQTMFASVNYRNVGITNNGDKSLTGALAVDGVLNLAAASGKIILGSSNLKIKPAGSITGTFSASRMIVTDGSGLLFKEVTNANPFLPGPTSFVFPVGSNNVYTPYTITTISATYTGVAYVAVRAIPLRQPNVPYYNNALVRYWDVATANITISSASIACLYVNTPGEVVGSNALYVPRVWNGTALIAPPGASGPASNPLISSGTTFLAGQWTAFDPTIRTTLYSYQSGDWANLDTWTTDPSGSTLISSIIPSSGDQVVILNGRTVTTAVSRTVGALTIENGGTLDLGSTSGHVLGSVDGQGLLRLSSTNYPGGLFTPFVSSTGGTIEYYDLPAGANVLANTPVSVNTYNNLIISNSTSSAFSANLNATTSVNGNFTLVKTGTGSTTFNVGSASGNFTLNLFKDVTIGAGCVFGVNNAYNGSHTVNIYGNLDVTGTLDLTNGVAYTTPSNGRATLRFLGAVTNTLATFNAGAVADLFDVTMQKNEGFELYVNASPTASVGFNGSGYTINPILGTLRLGSNITIPRLGPGGNYDLGAAGVLPVFWIDGANVTDGGLGGAIVPYGTLKITAGSLTCSNGQGAVVLRESGLLQIEGGVVNMKIFRTSTTAITHRGSFVMNGGTLNITGDNSGEGSYYSMFSLPYAENVFQMAGGTINITRTVSGGITPRGGIMIASNAQNQQVTGGTINVSVTGNQAFDITSTAPFFNMNISKASAGTGVLNLNAINWSYDGSGGNTATVPAQPLRILNNLVLVGSPALSVLGNGNNFEVGGNLTINSGVTFSSGLGSLVFNGNTAQTFTMSGTVGVAGIGGLSVNKNSLSTLTLSGSLASIPFTGALNLLSGTLADGGKSLLFGGNITNNATHTGAGRIVLNGTATQSIGGTGTGTFQNLEIANTGGVAGALQVTATNTLRVNGNFTLSTDRRMSIDIYKLILSASSQIIGTFSANRFIQTAGFLSDGGIVKPFNSTSAFVFPFGAGTNYTPSTIQFSSAPTTWGTLDVRPVTARQLYVTDPNTFIYHWKVRQTGFVGVPANSVNLTFNYGSLADNAAYIPAYYNYANIAYTQINDVTKVDEATNNILFTGVSYFNGDFTAGIPAAFGTVIPFYSRANGSWNSPSTWSNNATLKHAGAASASIPSSNSPVIIGDGLSFFHSVTIPSNNTVSGSLIVDAGSTLDLGTTTGNNFGALPFSTAGGAGRIKISSAGALAEFPAGDFGIFFTTEGGTTEYYAGSSSFAIPTFTAAPTSMQIRSYKNLILNPSATNSVTMPNRDLEVYSNLTVNGNAAGIANMNASSNKTLTIRGNLVATSGNLQFGSAIAQNVLVDGDINIAAAGALSVDNAGSESHSISLLGNITNNGTIDFSQASVVNISMIGANSRSISGTTPTATTSFNKLTINKGTSELTLVNVDVQGTFTAPSNNWLTLQNGTFRITKATTLTLTNALATNFLIPSTAALSLNHVGAVVNVAMGASNASDVILAGTLEILNGTMNIGNPANNVHNDLEYSASDVPVLLVQGNGTLNVNGQIRRSVSVLLGSLNYTQKNNSSVLIRGKNPETAASFNLNRAKFEIVNPGSQFTMMDNSLLIIDRSGLASGIYGDFFVNPSSSVVTGGEIRFGTTDTPPAASASTFLINTTIPFWNLTVDGTTTNKTVKLATDPIVVKSNFSVLGGSVFDANGLNLTIGGNFVNQNISSAAGVAVGGYRPGNINQTTTFNGSSAIQQMSGVLNNLSNFGNLVLDNTFAGGSVDLSANTAIRVNGNLTITNGGFNSSNNLATVAGNVTSNKIHTSIGAGYLVMGGTSNQIFSGNGSAQYGSVRVSNAAGIETENAMRINGDLNFTAGLFYINNHELTLGESATVSGTINASSMIRMNGVPSDGGVRKLYPATAYDFTFPIGVTLKYTPARINVTSNTVAGDVSMRLGNVKHPATTDVDNKELTYYWNTSATGFTPSTAVTHTYNYLQTDAINGVETNFRTGRYVNNVWNPQFGIASTVNAASNTMTLTGVNYFNGDFTAGEQSEFDQLLVFYSRNATFGGNWSDASSWSTDPILMHAGAAAGTAPSFNSVVIAAGHTITGTGNNISSPNAQVDGTLNLGNFIGHNLGTVSGSGTIQLAATALNQFIFPAGSFASFVSPGGGTIEYSNASATASLPSQGIYNNLVFSGAGVKALFNSDITVNGDLTINAGSISNPSNRNISLKGNLTNSAGNSAMQLGSIGALQLTGGAQSITGATTVGKLTVNGAGVKTLNSSITIGNQLLFTNGIIQTGANQVSLSLGALSSGASALSYVNGNFRKVISASTALRTFEVGDAITYTPVTLQFNGNTNSGGSITAYSIAGDHPSSASSGIDGSKSVNRHWGLINAGVSGFSDLNATLNFAIADLDPAVNPSSLSAARYNAPTWTAATVGTTSASSLQITGLTTLGEFQLAEPFSSGITWTGSVNSDWNNPGNWNPNNVPLSSSDVLIPVAANQPSFLTPGNGLVRNVVLQAGAILTIPTGYQIAVNGNWTGSNAQVVGGGKVQFTSPAAVHSGTTSFGCIVSVATGAVLNTGNTLTLANGSSLMHGVGTIGAGGSVVGTVRIRRTGTSGSLSYNYWSSPITNATSSVLGGNRYMYNPLNASGSNIIGLLTGWVNASNILTPGRGYIATGTGSANFFGTPNNGTINYGPLALGAFTSFNLIGNPYPSAINASSFVAANPQIQGGALYFWDDDNSNGLGYSASDYGVWNGIGFVAPNSGKTFSGDIASCQGFFIQANAATPLTFTNSMRTTQNSSFFDASILERVWVSVTTQENDYNETLIAFKGDATDGLDEHYDALKLKGNQKIAMFTKIGDGDYAINALSELSSDKMIQIGIEAIANGPQTLRLNQIDNLPETAQIILEDTKLGVFHNLRNNPDYPYSYDSTTDVLRFRLHFKPEVMMSANTESCVQNDGQIIISSPSATTWNYAVTNQNGEVISEGNDFSGNKTISDLAGGLYFVNLNNQLGSNFNQAIEVADGEAIAASISSNGTLFQISDASVEFHATVQGASDITWDFGDGTIVTGVLNPVHVYTAPGTFTVTFIASNATCMDVKSTFITVQDLTTGIDHVGNEVFSLFPNPASSITDIRLRLPEREEALTINVLDAAGKLVKTFNFNNVEKQARLQINVSDLASGVYQLLLTGNTYSSSARLNVMR